MRVYLIVLLLFLHLIFAKEVDKSRFTQLLSNHLLLDHYDKAFHQLSRKISQLFRDALQVKLRHLSENKVHTPPVDLQILKRQLRGAVGSFVEDKLPSILTSHYNTTGLQYQLNEILSNYCPCNDVISQSCLMQHKDLVLTEIEKFTLHEFQNTLHHVNHYDLPKLFEKTRAQIAGIIIHFNQHTMDEETILELRVKQRNGTSKRLATTTSALWITDEMMQEFISLANHTDHEEQDNSIHHFSMCSSVLS